MSERRDEPIFRPSVNEEVEEELSFHVAMRMRELIAGGMSPQEAREEAQRRFGDLPEVEAQLRRLGTQRDREQSRSQYFAELWSDVKYALRALARAPGFAIVAILTLALGAGANSGIFSVLNSVVLRPLAYAAPGELVRVYSAFPGIGFDKFWISPPEYFELRERNKSFVSMGGYRTGTTSVGGDEAPMRVTSAVATADLFTTLGVQPRLGRAFTEEEAMPNTDPVAVLSYELWQTAFGGDENILSRQIIVNGASTRVTGVMPPGFDVADAGVQIWRPAGLDPAQRTNSRGSHFLDVVARVRPGVTLEQVESDLRANVAQWQELNPGTHSPSAEDHPMFAVQLQEDMIGNARTALFLLLGAVTFVLLIACANVANLLLARAESRQREIAVRTALGAGRMRLIRQFLTEGVVLGLVGGLLGLLIGYVGVRALIAVNPRGVPRAAEIGLDMNVVLFTFGVAIVTGLIFGLAPALQVSGKSFVQALRDGSGRTTATGARLHTRNLLVVTEVALAVMLVVGSALMLRSFAQLQRVEPGFDPDNLLSFQLFLPPTSYETQDAMLAFHRRLSDQLRALPGVTHVSAMSGLPPRRDVNANDTEFEGLQQTEDGPAHNTDYWQFVTADYFETMKIPMRDGRVFNAADEAGAPVVVINQRLADVFYPDVNPIGRRLRPPGGDGSPWLTIIGIVDDVKQGGLDAEVGTELYFYYPQLTSFAGALPRTMNVIVRTQGDPTRVAATVNAEVRALDAALPVANMAAMTDVMHESIARPRFLTLLLAIFAAVALSLAAVGTYGVMAYSVAQRKQEIGIRMALGAQRSTVLGMVLQQGFSVAAIGLVLGIGGSLALSKLLSSLLFNVSTTDSIAFVGAPLLLAGVAVVACYVPARRATHVDPARVLKQD
jgi:predicted permease